MEGEVLEVPQYTSSLHRSSKQFLIMSMMVPRYGMSYLRDIYSATSILSFRKKLKDYLFTKTNQAYIYCVLLTVSVVWTPFTSLDFELFKLYVSWLLCLAFCLLMETKCYQSHIRIIIRALS